jgi:hypothetical protein
MADFDLGAFLEALKSNPEAMTQIRQVLDAPEENPWTPITPEQKVQSFTKLIAHGQKAPKPYVHQAWPTTMFHPVKPPKVVKDAAAAKALGPEWHTAPYEDMPALDATVMRGDETPVVARQKPGRKPKAPPVEV